MASKNQVARIAQVGLDSPGARRARFARQVKAAGGEWLEKQQLWRLAHDRVLTLD